MKMADAAQKKANIARRNAKRIKLVPKRESIGVGFHPLVTTEGEDGDEVRCRVGLLDR